MKRAIIVIIAACAFMQAIAQNSISSLYRKYENNQEVTSVYISEAMVNLMKTIVKDMSSDTTADSDIALENEESNSDRLEIEGVNISPILSKLKELYVLSTENRQIGQEIRKELVFKDNYTELMRIKDAGDDVNFYYRNSPDDKFISEIVMYVLSDSETVVISISTDSLQKQDLSQMANLMMKNM